MTHIGIESNEVRVCILRGEFSGQDKVTSTFPNIIIKINNKITRPPSINHRTFCKEKLFKSENLITSKKWFKYVWMWWRGQNIKFFHDFSKHANALLKWSGWYWYILYYTKAI